MRDFARIQFMTPRTGKLVFSLAAMFLMGIAFTARAAVPFSLNISGDYGTFFGDYPYFVIHNESRYNITEFDMTIGDINKNFDWVWYQYTPHGGSSVISP